MSAYATGTSAAELREARRLLAEREAASQPEAPAVPAPAPRERQLAAA